MGFHSLEGCAPHATHIHFHLGLEDLTLLVVFLVVQYFKPVASPHFAAFAFTNIGQQSLRGDYPPASEPMSGRSAARRMFRRLGVQGGVDRGDVGRIGSSGKWVLFCIAMSIADQISAKPLQAPG